MSDGERVDLSKLVLEELVAGEDPEETRRLERLLREAREFIGSHAWATPIVRTYLGFGVGDVVAVVLVELANPIQDRDRFLWVVVGDLPSAYLVTDRAPTAKDALRIYCELMEQWARRVSSGEHLDDVFPVRAEPTQENARSLLHRVRFLRETVLPEMSS